MILQDTDRFIQRIYPAGVPFPVDSDLFLQHLGRFTSKGGFVWKQIAPGIIFHAVTKGKGTVICNGVPFHAKQGDLFVFRKGNNYHYFDKSGSPWKYTYTIFGGSRADTCMDLLGFTAEHPVLTLPLSDSFWIRLESIYQEFKAGSMTHASPVRAAWHLFEELNKPHRQPNTLSKDALAETAHQMVESSPQPLTNVNDLANALNTSRVNLFRCFKERYGISIKEFMEQVRFERIEFLLQHMDTSIQDIARIGGFNDPLYFSRAFRKRNGLSPAQWRAQNQQ